jgi:hypothetical protein
VIPLAAALGRVAALRKSRARRLAAAAASSAITAHPKHCPACALGAKENVMKDYRFCAWLTASACALGLAAAAHAGAKLRIGVPSPKAQLGQGSSGADVSEPLRIALISYLSGPATVVTPLEARIPIQYEAEAKAAGIPYVLVLSVSHEKGRGGKLGKFLKTAAPVAAILPGVGAMGGMGGMVASQAAASAAMVASQQAQEEAFASLTAASQNNIRKGDELKLEFTLTKDGQPALANQLTRKATQDGEDMLSPLLEQVATEVITHAK